MESKKYIVYNKARETFLTSSASSVNSALEPLKVLKVLIEGLPANARTGLWLTNFKGVPVARTLSPFDLIYLDKAHRTLHGVELTKDAEFAPFKGSPASALVLPPGSISASKTRDGDELELRPLEIAIPEAAASEAPKAIGPEALSAGTAGTRGTTNGDLVHSPRFYSQAPQTVAPAMDNAPLERFVGAQAPLKPAESPRPENPPAAAPPGVAPEAAREAATLETINRATDAPPAGQPPAAPNRKRRLVTGPILTPHSPAKPAPQPAEPALNSKEPIPFPAVASGRPVPRIQEVPVEPPGIHLSPQQRSTLGSLEAPATVPSPPLPSVDRPAPVARPAPPATVSVGAPVIAEPVRTEPVARPQRVTEYGPEPNYPWRVRALRWLFPHLVDEDPFKTRERRRAERQSLPGLIAYFFTGGAPEPQKIRDISVTGFYLETEDRWMPGTVVRMTLQKAGSTGDDPSDTITVNSRIVRWGSDGEGFEFMLTDLEN